MIPAIGRAALSPAGLQRVDLPVASTSTNRARQIRRLARDSWGRPRVDAVRASGPDRPARLARGGQRHDLRRRLGSLGWPRSWLGRAARPFSWRPQCDARVPPADQPPIRQLPIPSFRRRPPDRIRASSGERRSTSHPRKQAGVSARANGSASLGVSPRPPAQGGARGDTGRRGRRRCQVVSDASWRGGSPTRERLGAWCRALDLNRGVAVLAVEDVVRALMQGKWSPVCCASAGADSPHARAQRCGRARRAADLRPQRAHHKTSPRALELPAACPAAAIRRHLSSKRATALSEGAKRAQSRACRPPGPACPAAPCRPAAARSLAGSAYAIRQRQPFERGRAQYVWPARPRQRTRSRQAYGSRRAGRAIQHAGRACTAAASQRLGRPARWPNSCGRSRPGRHFPGGVGCIAQVLPTGPRSPRLDAPNAQMHHFGHSALGCRFVRTLSRSTTTLPRCSPRTRQARSDDATQTKAVSELIPPLPAHPPMQLVRRAGMGHPGAGGHLEVEFTGVGTCSGFPEGVPRCSTCWT